MHPYDKMADHLFGNYEVDDRETILNFFITFSRMEYALKQSGFVSGGVKAVSADWDKLALELRASFRPDRTKILQESVEYILNHPPKKQVLQSNTLNWVDNIRPVDEQVLKKLLIFVRSIRNNFFHGEKIKGVLEGQPQRNLKLLKCSLTVLHECLDLCSSVSSCSHIPDYFLGEMKWELRTL